MVCYHFDTEDLLVNFLFYHDSSATYQNLKLIYNSIQAEFENELITIDFSKSAISAAVESYPQMFKWENYNVEKANGSEKYYTSEYISKFFNSEGKDSYINKAIEIIKRAPLPA